MLQIALSILRRALAKAAAELLQWSFYLVPEKCVS
jgi:hypothetical protein